MELHDGFLICDAVMKEKILREQKEIHNYIFFSIEDLRLQMGFQVKKNAIVLLMKQYKFSYSLALEYIAAIKNIEDKPYHNLKLDSIVSVMHFLKEKNALFKDELFYIRLKQFPVTFISPEQTKEYQSLKERVACYTQVYEYFPNKEEYSPEIYELPSILEESLFVMNKIKELVHQGIPYHRIYIIYPENDYCFLFKRLSKSYKIPIQFDAYKNIASTEFIKDFLKKCQKEASFSEILQQINHNHILFPILIDTLNSYELASEKPKDCIEFLKYHWQETKFPQKRFLDAVHFLQRIMIFGKEDYVFHLGFNLGNAPKYMTEEGFLSDKELDILHMSTSMEKNKLANDRLTYWLFTTPNLVVTYKNYMKNESCFPSLLLENNKLKINKNVHIPYGYARLEDELRLVGLYDSYVKYGHWSEDLGKYGIQNAQYKTFHHSYQELDVKVLQKHFKDKPLRLAYSNVKLYFACPFSYFADRILGLNDFQPQMAARLGTFAHAVLEDSYNLNFDLEQSVSLHQNENALDEKDVFFFTQMKEVLKHIIYFNRLHEASSQLEEILREVHIEIKEDSYIFEGYIDKLMYKVEDDIVYAAIIDYKTGADVVSLDNIEDGFHLQLPSYMYLLSHYPKFENLKIKIIGIYLQKVNIVIYDHKSDVESQMAKKFMLEGFSVANPSLLAKLDPTYYKSTYIKSLGMGKEGFLRYSKVFLEQQQEEIIHMVDGLLEQASSNILKGKFEISPKKILGKNVSCIFCKYKDICFYEYEDIKELEYKPFGRKGDERGMDRNAESSNL